MKSNTLSTMMCFLALGTSISARAIPENGIPENGIPESESAIPEPTTDLFVPSWDVAIEPGQDETIVVNGTIQQVDSYMEAHYPGWSAKLANLTASHSAPAKQAPGTRLPGPFNISSVICNQPLQRASTRAFLGAIDHLRTISKDRRPRNGPGPRLCGKVSCSDDGAIVVCNDVRCFDEHEDDAWCNYSDKFTTLERFSDLAFGAETVVNQCAQGGNRPMVSGKTYFSGDYSVIVGRWSCDAGWPSTGHSGVEMQSGIGRGSRR
ncbi:hypothetical protein E4U19_005460 [Claviceps sp. Clav32 group G5]|nr:hypothetical protein E4U19_005460 [Claviceps sp. Clav32 group G5]